MAWNELVATGCKANRRRRRRRRMRRRRRRTRRRVKSSFKSEILPVKFTHGVI